MRPYEGKEIQCILLLAVFSVSAPIGGVCILMSAWYALLGAGGAYNPALDLLIVAGVSIVFAVLSFAAIWMLDPVIPKPPKRPEF